jgi:hypothetical protein
MPIRRWHLSESSKDYVLLWFTLPDRHSHTSLAMVILIWSSSYDLSGSL